MPFTKTFKGDIEYLTDLIRKKQYYAFSKYADGEFAILANQQITNCDGWTFDPDTHEFSRMLLIDSFLYKQPGYLVGISCPCCQPKEHVDWMRQQTGRQDDWMTWANVWVNSNYDYFINNTMKEIAKYPVVLVSNKDSDIKTLEKSFKLKVVKHYPIGDSALFNNDDLLTIDTMTNDIVDNTVNDHVYLFSAGPLGNVLAASGWKTSMNNFYLDVGSTLNPYLTGELNRGYLKQTNRKTCIW